MANKRKKRTRTSKGALDSLNKVIEPVQLMNTNVKASFTNITGQSNRKTKRSKKNAWKKDKRSDVITLNTNPWGKNSKIIKAHMNAVSYKTSSKSSKNSSISSSINNSNTMSPSYSHKQMNNNNGNVSSFNIITNDDMANNDDNDDDNDDDDDDTDTDSDDDDTSNNDDDINVNINDDIINGIGNSNNEQKFIENNDNNNNSQYMDQNHNDDDLDQWSNGDNSNYDSNQDYNNNNNNNHNNHNNRHRNTNMNNNNNNNNNINNHGYNNNHNNINTYNNSGYNNQMNNNNYQYNNNGYNNNNNNNRRSMSYDNNNYNRKQFTPKRMNRSNNNRGGYRGGPLHIDPGSFDRRIDRSNNNDNQMNNNNNINHKDINNNERNGYNKPRKYYPYRRQYNCNVKIRQDGLDRDWIFRKRFNNSISNNFEPEFKPLRRESYKEYLKEIRERKDTEIEQYKEYQRLKKQYKTQFGHEWLKSLKIEFEKQKQKRNIQENNQSINNIKRNNNINSNSDDIGNINPSKILGTNKFGINLACTPPNNVTRLMHQVSNASSLNTSLQNNSIPQTQFLNTNNNNNNNDNNNININNNNNNLWNYNTNLNTVKIPMMDLSRSNSSPYMNPLNTFKAPKQQIFPNVPFFNQNNRKSPVNQNNSYNNQTNSLNTTPTFQQRQSQHTDLNKSIPSMSLTEYNGGKNVNLNRLLRSFSNPTSNLYVARQPILNNNQYQYNQTSQTQQTQTQTQTQTRQSIPTYTSIDQFNRRQNNQRWRSNQNNSWNTPKQNYLYQKQ